MTQEERFAVVESCKWVDEVTLDAPYTTTLATLDKFDIDFCVHGEDTSYSPDGQDSFAEVKKAGKFKYIKRTAGVSTTDIVGRMLLATKNHFQTTEQAAEEFPEDFKLRTINGSLISSHTIYQFTDGKVPKPGDVTGYLCGSFDLFHAGHVDVLRRAKEQCDFLIVGVFSDQIVNKQNCKNPDSLSNAPVMNLNERVLVTLSCKYVDEVIIGPPVQTPKEWFDARNVTKVFHNIKEGEWEVDGEDAFQNAKELGIYVPVETDRDLSSEVILQRIINNRLNFKKKVFG